MTYSYNHLLRSIFAINGLSGKFNVRLEARSGPIVSAIESNPSALLFGAVRVAGRTAAKKSGTKGQTFCERSRQQLGYKSVAVAVNFCFLELVWSQVIKLLTGCAMKTSIFTYSIQELCDIPIIFHAEPTQMNKLGNGPKEGDLGLIIHMVDPVNKFHKSYIFRIGVQVIRERIVGEQYHR
jgi:hypothetical protein